LLDVLTAVRRRFETPVVMMTAAADDVTKLSSLRIGADDYVVKPFNPSEVVERIRAVLRRTLGFSGRRTLVVGKLTIELDARLNILVHMARQPRRAFSRTERIAV
jgi:two-component system response regulator AdeR